MAWNIISGKIKIVFIGFCFFHYNALKCNHPFLSNVGLMVAYNRANCMLQKNTVILEFLRSVFGYKIIPSKSVLVFSNDSSRAYNCLQFYGSRRYHGLRMQIGMQLVSILLHFMSLRLTYLRSVKFGVVLMRACAREALKGIHFTIK